MPTREQFNRWDADHVWHAFTQMSEYEPLIIECARGCILIDIDGNEYLDGVSSLWCNVHGHRHPRLDAALRDQLDKIAHCTSLGMSNPATIELARRLVELAPDGLRHVFFSSDGSSAVEVALKMAFQYWQQRDDPRPEKTKYVALDAAYHGDTIGSASVGGIERFHAMFHPLLFEVFRLPAPGLYRLPEGVARHQAGTFYLGKLESLLEQHHQEIAAVVIEPLMQCQAGMIVHPQGFLSGVRELTTRYDVLLIADEIAVGFGRTGTLFACEQENVTPDFLCLGKGITGGYMPLAATLTTNEVWQAFLGKYEDSKTFFHGHTYGGNPLAAAVANASLDVFHQEQTLAQLPEKISRLQNHLVRIAEHPHVGDVRQCGLAAGIELVADRATRQPYPWAQRRGIQACSHALEQGVWLRPLGNVLVIMPPLAISLDQLDQILLAAESGIAAATQD